ncbi:MAG: hypothetical protein EOP84_32495, partial [Verrucomicrobiaceae bacterium]
MHVEAVAGPSILCRTLAARAKCSASAAMLPAFSATPDDFAPLAEIGDALSRPETSQDPDVQLMLEVAAGSETAFTELVRKHQNPLLNFFARMGASSDCEDLVQETFVRLF